jgi:hypothetical protein
VVLNAADVFGRDNEEAAAIIREKEDFEYFSRLFGGRRFATRRLPVSRFWSTDRRMRKRSRNLVF